MRQLFKDQTGFTLPELTISIAVATIVSILMFLVFTTFYGSILRADAESRLVVESQIILRNIGDELRIARAVRDTNLNPDPNQPAGGNPDDTGGWATSLANAILIIALPARDENKEFIIDPLTGEPYENEVVYFADGGTLYRRTIPDSNAAGNTLGPTCPAAIATPSCIEDRVLTENYDVLNFIFYDQDDAVTVDTNIARSVEMTIEMNRSIFGGLVEIDNNIRMTLRN